MTVTIRVASPPDIPRILTAYSAWGYAGGIQTEDTGWLAEAGDDLIGIVRIAPENGTFVLRGMRIADAWRRRGIGTQMLRALAAWLGDRDCYCVPYTHLVGFYTQIGFAEILPGSAPVFLAERLSDYRQRRGLQVTLMRRAPTSSSPAAPLS